MQHLQQMALITEAWIVQDGRDTHLMVTAERLNFRDHLMELQLISQDGLTMDVGQVIRDIGMELILEAITCSIQL